VGWQLLGQAYLARRNFAECENYFRLVVSDAEALMKKGVGSEQLIGDHIDERFWPLGLIRAWGHLGLALSYTERDGKLSDASDELKLASDHAGLVKDRKRFPTRIDAAISDGEGFIRQRDHNPAAALTDFKEAIGTFPYSRSYMHLVEAIIELARRKAATRDDLEDAERALVHAASLRPSDLSTDEIDHLRDELAAAAA
jgi:hypothetical protein